MRGVVNAIASAALACSSSATGGGSDPFVGTWTCTDSATTNFTQPAGTPPTTASTTATVTITDDGKGNVTAVREPDDAGAACTLRSTLSADGRSTTLLPNQTCTLEGGGTLTYTSGGSTLGSDGSRSTQSAWSFSGTTKTGAPLVGTGSGSGHCVKP
jgi:hypothetical protein